jgi:uncharacterized membrane protein YphA (DoxX/SURF4 family)
MDTMDSMAQAPAWKSILGWVGASLLALIFLVSGIWKLVDTRTAAVLMSQMKVPQSLSVAAAIGFGIAETFAAILLLTPRFRRWGAYLGGGLMVAFMIYIGMYYTQLRGAECSCFPWVKRTVGPMFFVSDGLMLLCAIIAGVWSRRAQNMRAAITILGIVALFAAGSYGIAGMRQTGTKAPDTVTVDGKPYSLQEGQVFIFYFDPECLHCLDAAKRMSKLNWGATRIVAVPINVPQFAQGFLEDTHLKAVISNDLPQLKKIFPFVSAPAGVALVNGHEKMALTQFEDPEPAETLKKIGFIE